MTLKKQIKTQKLRYETTEKANKAAIEGLTEESKPVRRGYFDKS